MYKKILTPALILTLTLSTMLKADVVQANDTILFEETIENQETEETTEAVETIEEAAPSDVYEQTKQVLVFNDVEESTERLNFCNNVEEENLQENINSILLEDVKLKETNAVISDASNNVAESITTTERETVNQVNDTIYDNLDVSVDDEILLATIIFCEAGNQSYEGKVAVGNVVLNRVASSKFSANTVKDVIYAQGQFEPVSMGWFDSELAKGHVDESCLQAARDAINGVNIVGDRTFFHVAKSTDDGFIIGDHIFY